MANELNRLNQLLDKLLQRLGPAGTWTRDSLPDAPPAQQTQQEQSRPQAGPAERYDDDFPRPGPLSRPLNEQQTDRLRKSFVNKAPDTYGATTNLLGAASGIVPFAGDLAIGRARLRNLSEAYDNYRRTQWLARQNREPEGWQSMPPLEKKVPDRWKWPTEPGPKDRKPGLARPSDKDWTRAMRGAHGPGGAQLRTVATGTRRRGRSALASVPPQEQEPADASAPLRPLRKTRPRGEASRTKVVQPVKGGPRKSKTTELRNPASQKMGRERNTQVGGAGPSLLSDERKRIGKKTYLPPGQTPQEKADDLSSSANPQGDADRALLEKVDELIESNKEVKKAIEEAAKKQAAPATAAKQETPEVAKPQGGGSTFNPPTAATKGANVSDVAKLAEMLV